MKAFHKKIIHAVLLCTLTAASAAPAAYAEGFLSRIFFFGRGESFSQKERTMKDLLRAAIDQAVFEASQVNGFYHQPDLKIDIPEKVRKIEKISRKMGGDLFWHDFELGLNRAAEKAAPRAAVLMKDALEELKFEKDPEEILSGEGLTNYFRRKMENKLLQNFKQEIERSISEESSLASYTEIKNMYASIPFVKNSDEIFALEDELSRKALDGIFARIAEQENRLRSVHS